MATLTVTGMTCDHCVRAVTEAVQAVPGAQDVRVDLASGTVRVAGSADPEALRAAIAEEGYEVRSIAA
jgi:copper chaperone